jgi:CelD/BcsL family acetyltransferase involved in cellulose biosynthesis
MNPRHLLSRSLRKLVSPLLRAGSVPFFERDLAIPVPRAKAASGFEVRVGTPRDVELLCEGRQPARPEEMVGARAVVRGGCAVNLTPHADQGRALPARQLRLASDLRVETFTDIEAFLKLEPTWDDLVERAQIDHPFLTHACVRSWWEAFGAGKELRIIAVFSGQTCIGLAPLMMRTAPMYGIPLRRLELIGNVHTPHSDFIIAARPAEAYRAILAELEKQGPGWDVVVLPQLAGGSRTLEELERLARGDRLLTGTWTAPASPRLRLNGSWESYLKSRAAKHRSNLRNRLGRLQRLGRVELEEICGGEQLATALEYGLRIEAAAWKGAGGTAIASQPESRRFYESFAERAAQRGWLRLQFLRVGGKRIAFNYCLRFRNTLYILKQGYDPEYAPYSPFNLLCFYLLQDAFRSGVSAVDFLGSEEPWKRTWTEESHGHSWLYLFQDRWRTRPIHFAKFRVLPALKSTGFYSAMRAAWQALWAPRQLPQRSR